LSKGFERSEKPARAEQCLSRVNFFQRKAREKRRKRKRSGSNPFATIAKKIPEKKAGKGRKKGSKRPHFFKNSEKANFKK